jgi:hypothetical protein
VWTVVPYPTRTTEPRQTWNLYEFGSPRVPARPFIRPALLSNTGTIARLMIGRS